MYYLYALYIISIMITTTVIVIIACALFLNFWLSPWWQPPMPTGFQDYCWRQLSGVLARKGDTLYRRAGVYCKMSARGFQDYC